VLWEKSFWCVGQGGRERAAILVGGRRTTSVDVVVVVLRGRHNKVL